MKPSGPRNSQRRIFSPGCVVTRFVAVMRSNLSGIQLRLNERAFDTRGPASPRSFDCILLERKRGLVSIAGGKGAALSHKIRDEHVKVGLRDSLGTAFTSPKDWFGKVVATERRG